MNRFTRRTRRVQSSRSTRLNCEPLEPRIAPALLVEGGNWLGGTGHPTTGETSVGENYVTVIKVLSGQVYAWFDGEHLTGISVGPNTKLDLTGDVGDIVANLTADGHLTDSDNNPLNGADGGRLLANNILGITTHQLCTEQGSIGHIITGGSINNLSINGTLNGAYAGDGVFRAGSRLLASDGIAFAYAGADTNPVLPESQPDFVLLKEVSTMAGGASISNATIRWAIEQQIFAGDGSPFGTSSRTGVAGGSVHDITITYGRSGDGTPTYDMRGGDGGPGISSGGAGGGVYHIVDTSTTGIAWLTGGNGGTSTSGRGGAGGAISQNSLLSPSTGYTLIGGDGGDGVSGGVGGGLLFNNLPNNNPNHGLVLTGDFTGQGTDDVIIVDGITGKLTEATPTQNGYELVVQSWDQYGNPIYTVDSLGTNPVDATAVDYNNDGYLDVVVAYKDSGNVVVYLNKGGIRDTDAGIFFENKFTPEDYKSFSASAGVTPHQISLMDDPDSAMPMIAIVGDTVEPKTGANVTGVSKLTGEADPKTHVITMGVAGNPLLLGARLGLSVGIATGATGDQSNPEVAIVATQGGSILSLYPKGSLDKPDDAFSQAGGEFDAGVGIVNIENDKDQSHILALNPVTKTLTILSVHSGGSLSLDQEYATGTDQALNAHYGFDDTTDQDVIGVIYRTFGGSRLDILQPPVGVAPSGTFSATHSYNTDAGLVDFSFAPLSVGTAAISNAMSRFVFTTDYVNGHDYNLPFDGKMVIGYGGHGGDARDASRIIGTGGAGGSIYELNASAIDVRLEAGGGGNSTNGAAGIGGSVNNPVTFVPYTGTKLTPAMLADSTMYFAAGDGGDAVGTGSRSAVGGAGGSLTSLVTTLNNGIFQFAAGDGGSANGINGGTGGAGGSISKLTATAPDTSILAIAGDGGDAHGKAGAGGGISSLQYTLTLVEAVELKEEAFNVGFVAGHGGTSTASSGGTGGGISGLTLMLDGSYWIYDEIRFSPPWFDIHRDNTVRVSIEAGDGGNGATGGEGGGVTKLSATSWLDQYYITGWVVLNPVVADVHAGDGGNGTAGNGGNGGGISSVTMTGMSRYDRDVIAPDMPVVVVAGSGGNGSVKGGNGGGIDGFTSQNAKDSRSENLRPNELAGASLFSGDGGSGGTSDGGAGGNIQHLLGATLNEHFIIVAGDGGDGGTASGATAGKGGAGGSILNSSVGSIVPQGSEDPQENFGLYMHSGTGGDGRTAGGAGGAVKTINLNIAQVSTVDAALIYAGDGGAASLTGAVGGRGGDISGIIDNKDVTSDITVLQAGNGGASPLGIGGLGGSVMNVSTVGYIGKPSTQVGSLGVFSNTGVAQGAFSGRGGDGATDGIAGSVTQIRARQIAAIAAAPDDSGHFAPATKIANIYADLIGYDADRDGQFDYQGGVAGSPSSVVPIDGFILGLDTVVQSITGWRANFKFNS